MGARQTYASKCQMLGPLSHHDRKGQQKGSLIQDDTKLYYNKSTNTRKFEL